MPHMCMCASALRRDHRSALGGARSQSRSRRDGAGGGGDSTGAVRGRRGRPAAARQRPSALRVEPDAARTPGRSMAEADGRCKLTALETVRNDEGGDLTEARAFLVAALARSSNVHRAAVFRAWVTMEEQAGSDARRVRKLFEAWSRAYRLGGGRKKLVGGGGGEGGEERDLSGQDDDEGGFWCRYIDFELRHGTAASVRVVAERAVAACPRHPAVHAKYATAELRLGCPDRAGAVLLSALDLFAADARTREWLEREVATYDDAMSMGQRHGGIWRRLRDRLLPFCRRRSGMATGYELLAVV
ncbi:hypothetical protein U9M48_032319 [Paspalum notatum var. saurae]|uniref:Uncharacterized protein n=1 Tax=Paspalum notatum var. saurae TaxID=547442 RepID=A0AAQ3U4T1_PASNO